MRRHLLARQVLNEDTLEPLVRRTTEGDARAWGELWCALAPMIDTIAGRFRVTSSFPSRCAPAR